MLSDDGRLALIDYGNAPRLTLEERCLFAHLIIALDTKDDAAIVAYYRKLGAEGTGNRLDDLLLLSAYGDFDQQYGKA